MEISARDKKLLVYLLAISIIAGAYFFVAKPLLDKQAALTDEISELQQRVTHYTEIYNNMESYEGKIAEAQTKYSETCNKLFGGLNQDNTIMMVKDLEDTTDVWIARLSFNEEEVVFGEAAAEGEAVDEASADGTGDVAATDATDGTAAEGGEAEAAGPASIQGVRQDLNIDYAASYDNFKRFIEYIENYDERLFISSINATYSVDSGLVGGSIVLSQYAILGTDKEYKAPEINNVQLGNDTIFKTGTTLLAPDSGEGLESPALAEGGEAGGEGSESSSEGGSDNEASSGSGNNSGNNEAQPENNGGSGGNTPSKPNGPAGGII